MSQNLKTLNGTLVYVVMQEPSRCFEAAKGSEWKAGIVVDEDTADAFGELYPKQAAKAVKTTEFEDIYKIPAPNPEAKKQYVITLRKNTKLANGEDVPDKYRPRAFLNTEEGRQDITFETLVGNGSKGKISIEHYEGKLGAVARLQNVLVNELVEYVASASGSSEAGSEFDDEDTPSKPVSKPAAKPAAKSVAKKVESSDDSSDPF
jgi:hypothetical protein